MAADEKTLKIKVIHGAEERPSDKPSSEPAKPQTPAQPQTPVNYLTGKPSSTASPAPKPVTPTTVPNAPPIATAASVAAPIAGKAAASLAPAAAAGGASSGAVVGAAAGAGIGAALAPIVGPLMIVVGGLVAGLGALATAATLVSSTFARMSEHLSQYDPGIAMAEGISEMRKIQADIKAAGDRSSQIQAVTKARTDIDVTMTEIGTSLTRIIAPVAVRLLAIMEKILTWIEFGLKTGEEVWKKISEALADPLNNKLLLFVLAPILPSILAIKAVMALLDRWLKIQLDEDQDASKFQQDIIDALNPHRADIREMGRQFEGGRTPKRVQL